jgi:hypothetical protein
VALGWPSRSKTCTTPSHTVLPSNSSLTGSTSTDTAAPLDAVREVIVAERRGQSSRRAPTATALPLCQFGAVLAGYSCETSLCPGCKDSPARGNGIGHKEWAGSAARIERYIELSIFVVFADTFSRTIRLQRLQIDSV